MRTEDPSFSKESPQSLESLRLPPVEAPDEVLFALGDTRLRLVDCLEALAFYELDDSPQFNHLRSVYSWLFGFATGMAVLSKDMNAISYALLFNLVWLGRTSNKKGPLSEAAASLSIKERMAKQILERGHQYFEKQTRASRAFIEEYNKTLDAVGKEGLLSDQEVLETVLNARKSLERLVVLETNAWSESQENIPIDLSSDGRLNLMRRVQDALTQLDQYKKKEEQL